MQPSSSLTPGGSSSLPCWSLRGLISALAVASVAAIAVVTLSITLTTSFDALHMITKKGALAILANARQRTETFFNGPVDALDEIRNLTYRDDSVKMPTADRAVGQRYVDYLLAVTRARKLFAVLHFADGSRILSVFDTLETGDAVFGTQLIIPGTPDGDDLFMSAPFFYDTNLSRVADGVAQRYITHDLIARNPYSITNGTSADWVGFLRGTGGGKRSTFLGLEVLIDVLYDPGVALNVAYLVPLLRPTPGASGSTLFAFVAMSSSVDAVEDMLVNAVANFNGGIVVLAYTGAGGLIATSTPHFAAFTRFEQLHLHDSVPLNCLTDLRSSVENMTTNTTKYLCPRHFTDYPDFGVAAAASDDFAFSPVPTVTSITVNGVAYIMASGPVAIGYPGASVHLLTSIEESSITGDVVQGRNIAIGVTAGAVVVIALSSFALVTVLLRPLSRVAARMELAARLDEDAEPMAPSSVAEVRALQYSLDAMSTELLRIRSFVPHSVMTQPASRDASHATHDAYLCDTETTCSGTILSSPRSRTRVVTSTFSASRQLNIALGLSSASVAVLVANCDGFLPKVLAATHDEVTRGIASIVSNIVEVVNAYGGVLSFFHGDHFVATFNAAQPCSSATRRAVAAGLAICDQTNTSSVPSGDVDSRCRMTVGVSSGRCLVGNVGCVGAMNFATIGAPYTQATVLQRLNRHYGTKLLSTYRAMRAVDWYFKLHLLDIIALSSDNGSHPTVIVAVIGSQVREVDDSNDTGLYLVLGASHIDDFEHCRQEVFDLIARGHYADAIAEYDALQCRADVRNPPASVDDADRSNAPMFDALPDLIAACRREVLHTMACEGQGEASPLRPPLVSDLGAYYATLCRKPPTSSERVAAPLQL